jgi:D-alanyl-D-alanine carboxypeptidase
MIVSTPRDMTTFITALFGGKLVSEDSLSLMLLGRNRYGKGLIFISFSEYAGYGQDGTLSFFRFPIYSA